MSLIIIGIGTYKRNELLENALHHIAKLKSPKGKKLCLVISDNNEGKEAYPIYKAAKNYIPFEVYYVHEPAKSIAEVRNAVLKKAIELNGEYIAFLDDDEYPKENWIEELYKTMIEYDADGATSAPLVIKEGKECSLPLNIKKRKHGSRRNICITNSVIFKSEIITKSNIWFDKSFGLMTGEDIDFFSRATAAGYKFVWCSKQLIYDVLHNERTSIEWEVDRAINNGYLKIFLTKKSGKNVSKKYYKTMLDTCIFSFLGLLIFLNKSLRKKCLLKLMDCFGKLKSIHSSKAYQHYQR